MKKYLMILGSLLLTVNVMADKAPEFTLTDTNGKSHTLSDYKGKIVVLEWVNHNCPFVKKHYNSKNMQELQAKYTEKGVVWLSICSSAEGKQGYNSPEEANKLTESKGASPSALLIDSSGETGKAYGAKTTPEMAVIDKDGNKVYQGAIDSDPGFNVKGIETATNYVSQVLDAVLAGKASPLSNQKPYGCSIKYAR